MEQGEREAIVPSNNRTMQRQRRPRRDAFGKAKKEMFIEALSCSCNVAAAAQAAGIGVNTVYTHRRTDPVFRDLWWQALEQGAAKLIALRLQREIERAEGGEGALDVRMDGPPDERQIANLYKLIHLLSEHSRALSPAGNVRPSRPQMASIDETCRALAKRLKAFGLGAEAEAALAGPDGAAG